VLSLGRNSAEHVGTDFHVFWQAGRDFVAGLPLYEPVEGARHFIYPPFAAMLFAPFGLLPLGAAGVVFHAASLLLAAACVRWTWRIAEACAPERNRRALPLVLAVLATVHIALSNLSRNQSNILVLALCLGGVLAMMRGRPRLAAALLVAATFLKLTPVFVLLLAMVRGGRKLARAWLIMAALAVLLPIALRGPARGFEDHWSYGAEFLAEFARGRVVTRPTNQALSAAISRAAGVEAGDGSGTWAWLPAEPRLARTATVVAGLLLLGGFAAGVVLLRCRRSPVSMFEVSAALLLGHLLSGITWKAHLVSLVFVFYAVLSLPLRRWPPASRAWLTGLCALILVSGLAGRDLVGGDVQRALFGYSAWTWLLLLLFGASMALALARPERLGGWATSGRRSSGWSSAPDSPSPSG
jgi:Glycosyltransferase family 87